MTKRRKKKEKGDTASSDNNSAVYIKEGKFGCKENGLANSLQLSTIKR